MNQVAPPANPRHYRYYDLLMAGFVTVLLCSNLIGPGKACVVSLPFAIPLIGAVVTFGAGNIFSPISYIFGDVLTEVYGFARSRKVIWAGFGAMIFATREYRVLARRKCPVCRGFWHAMIFRVLVFSVAAA